MSHDLKLTDLEFGSLFTYTPSVQSESQKKAKDVMYDIKYYRYVEDKGRPVLISEYISNYIKKEIGNLPFSNFFDNNPMLVPVPNSSKRQEDTLWVPHRLATALHFNGFGMCVSIMLERNIALRKAAWSPAKDRPKALEHFNSLEVQDILSLPKHILLIDDVVTRSDAPRSRE
jgi:predicted amidophosphoribosyltransferase